MSSTADRYTMPWVISASSASRDAGSPKMPTAPPRVHAHSARSCIDPVTTVLGSPTCARAALGADFPLGAVHAPTPRASVPRSRSRRVRRHRRPGRWPLRHPPPHDVDGVVERARRDIVGDGTDRHTRRQLGVDPVHRRLIGLHPPGEADGLVRRPPRPARLGVLARGELSKQRGCRVGAQLHQVGDRRRSCGLRRLHGSQVGFGADSFFEHPGPEVVHLGQVPQQVRGGPIRACGAVRRRLGGGEHVGKSLRLGVDDRDAVHELSMPARQCAVSGAGPGRRSSGSRPFGWMASAMAD